MPVSEQSYPNLRPFRSGQSGNPAGRPKQVATKLIREMSEELAEGSNETRLRKIVDTLLAKAEAGDLEAVKIVSTGWRAAPASP